MADNNDKERHEREERERREREQREREQREKQQQEKQQQEKQQQQKPGGQQPKGTPKEAGDQEKVGEPMRKDDQQNQFRAPDVKALGTIFGEDLVHPAGGTDEEIPVGLPPETHAQVPGQQATTEEEQEATSQSARR